MKVEILTLEMSKQTTKRIIFLRIRPLLNWLWCKMIWNSSIHKRLKRCKLELMSSKWQTRKKKNFNLLNLLKRLRKLERKFWLMKSISVLIQLKTDISKRNPTLLVQAKVTQPSNNSKRKTQVQTFSITNFLKCNTSSGNHRRIKCKD